MKKGSVRRDPVSKNWVIFAPEKVGTILEKSKEQDVETSADSCPFCPGNEYATGTELFRYNHIAPSNFDWSLRAFPARNPVMKIEEELKFMGDGVYDFMGRFGAHEVIVETPRHDIHIDELTEKEIEDIFWAFHDRIVDLKRDTRFKYIMVYKNRGKKSGGKMDHHYSELAAFPFIPPSVEAKIRNASTYYGFKQRCVFCDIVNQELSQRSRIVDENHEFVAFCPYASVAPFEIKIMPKGHRPYFEDSSKHSFISLARIFRDTMYRIRRASIPPHTTSCFTAHRSSLLKSMRT